MAKMEDVFGHQEDVSTLNLIIKADVQGHVKLWRMH